MHDNTEPIRRMMVDEINAEPSPRELLEADYGKHQVWDTDELKNDFEVHSFMSPFVVVTRTSDGLKGTVMFQHSPRLYFNFVPSSAL